MSNVNIYKKVLTIISFLMMTAVNILANVLPINGMTTGDISDNYPSLITPAGYTFLIWMVIYILLCAYVVYQLEFIRCARTLSPKISDHVRLFFAFSCLCNTAWIFAWHYRYIALSLVLIITILVCLSIINKYVYLDERSHSEKFFVRLPFSIYFGWITVATMVNASVLLISIGWHNFGIPAQMLTIVAALIIVIIASYYTLKNRSIVFAATVIWAYVGIVVKHTSKSGFNSKYPEIVFAIMICILLLLIEMGYVLINKKKYGF
ncbi:MAG: hypothetical protein K0R34_3943 [Herbinix sp.]|nr:hypothetical protein [Herbinix sp.]